MAVPRKLCLLLITALALSKVSTQSDEDVYCGNPPVDVIFLVDSSNEDFNKSLNVVADVVKMLTIGENETRVGLAIFNLIVELKFNLNKYFQKKELIKAIQNVTQPTTYSHTATHKALQFMRDDMLTAKAGMRPNDPHIAIVITGQSDWSLDLENVANEAKEEGIHIFSVGVGDAKLDQMKTFASQPASENAFKVDDPKLFDSIKNTLSIQTCKVIRPMPTTTPTTTICHSKPLDIVFAIDFSGNMTEHDIWYQKHFVRDFFKGLDIRFNMSRVGIVLYADKVTSFFDLVGYNSLVDNLNKFFHLDWRLANGSSILKKVINYVSTESFRRKNTRNYVPKFLVLLTGSSSRYLRGAQHHAQLAAISGVNIITVDFAGQPNTGIEELKNEEAFPIQRLFQVENASVLSNVLDKALVVACTVCDNRQETDIMFVIDRANAGRRNTKKTLDFVEAVAKYMLTYMESVQVGIMIPEFLPLFQSLSLGAYDKDELSTALETHTMDDFADTLESLKSDGFSSRNGGRTDARKIAVIIVDDFLTEEALIKVKEAHDSGIEVNLILVGPGKPQYALRKMCRNFSAIHCFQVPDYYELKSLKANFIQSICAGIVGRQDKR